MFYAIIIHLKCLKNKFSELKKVGTSPGKFESYVHIKANGAGHLWKQKGDFWDQSEHRPNQSQRFPD